MRAGGTVALRATVRDRNPNDTLQLEWRATGGAFGTPSGGTITWTAPLPGPTTPWTARPLIPRG
ncbi:hypothetical protein ACN28S_67340 [Cystobacter fuscus]